MTARQLVTWTKELSAELAAFSMTLSVGIREGQKQDQRLRDEIMAMNRTLTKLTPPTALHTPN